MAEEDLEQTPPPETPVETPPAAGKESIYILKERYTIDFSSPMVWLDTNGAKAYKVEDKINDKRELFALVCNNVTSPRSSLLPYLKSIDHQSIMKLVEYGVISYPVENSRNMALIYETPLGGRVIDSAGAYCLKNQPEKFKTVLLSLLSAVEVLRSYGITHRAIRADNVYYRDENREHIGLGDCIASFPAYHQPAAAETIESLMAQKDGRGNGSDKNDIYAVGALMLQLYLGHGLLEELTETEMLRLKLKKGSYQTLLDADKTSAYYASIFRGLLNDIEENRWTYTHTYSFVEGKQVNITQSSVERPKKALTVNGEKVYNLTDVAYTLLQNPEEGYEQLKAGKITDWIKNGLENEKLNAQVDKLLHTNGENTANRELLISKLCIILAPNLPIKYKNLWLFPGGIPKAIFHAVKSGESLNSFYELFNTDLIKAWYQEQTSVRAPANASEFKAYISRKDMGYGIDRIMYDFDEDLPCISPLLGDEFVNSAPRILRALDHTYATGKVTSMPYDKNIMAYLRCKMGKKIDGILTDLNTGREALQASAILRLYTDMQNKYGPAQLPNLAKWLVSACMLIIKSYHNVKYQKYLERELLKVHKNGKLYEITAIIEDEEARQKDSIDYANALKNANLMISEKNNLVNNTAKWDEEAKSVAMRFASVLAVLTMITSFVLNLFFWILK